MYQCNYFNNFCIVSLINRLLEFQLCMAQTYIHVKNKSNEITIYKPVHNAKLFQQ